MVATSLNNTTDLITAANISAYPNIPLGKFIGISVGVFAGLGIVINSIVLVVVLLAQKTRFTCYKYLMCHLAFSDLLCSIMLTPYVPLELADHNWIYKDGISCQFIYPFISFFTNVSTGTILIISLERYRGVMYPHRKQWTPRDALKAFIIVWVVSLILVLPNSIKLKVNKYKNIDYCNEYWENQTYRKIYGFSFFAFAFAIPLIAITVMHVIIMLRLRSPELRPDNMTSWQEKQNKRIMRVLTGIIVVFFVCVCPNKILYFVWDVRPDLEVSPTSKARLYLRTFQFLYWSRVAVDPLIYCFFDTRFKKDLSKSGKIIRGLSFVDSDVIRSRSASQRTSTILSVRSRANSAFIVDDLNGDALKAKMVSTTMTKIHEIDTTSLNKAQNNTPPETYTNDRPYMNGVTLHDINMERRLRSDTVDTDVSSQHGSASPLVSSAFARKT